MTSILKYYLFLTVFCSFWVFPKLQAQENNTTEATDTVKIFKEVRKNIQRREFLSSIALLDEVIKQDSSNLAAHYLLGICHLRALHKEDAYRHLQFVFKRKPQYTDLMFFYLAEAEKYNNMMAQAIEHYKATQDLYADFKERYVQLVNDVILLEEFRQLLKQRIREAEHGTRYLADPTNAKVENIGKTINSKYADYAPVISADESILIFTSRRKGTTGRNKDNDDNLFYEDIYISKRKNDKWEKPRNIGKNINTKYHEASIALSPDGTQLFIYQDENNGDIYVSELKDREKNDWGKPQKLGDPINTKHREPSVSISEDGNTLYFSSNRPGGFGGLDLYKVEKNQKGKWGEPINLGPAVNTAQDEDAPFIHYDSRTLYFSSRGHHSMGGFDIYFTEEINGKWTKPVNLGYPINTPGDDTHFVLSADYKRGYYASAKKDSEGDKDIYIIRMPDYQDIELIDFDVSLQTLSVDFSPLITNPTKRALVVMRGTVRDELSNQLLNCKMTVIDVEDFEVIEEINAVNPKGVYYTQMTTGKRYLLHVQKEGYLYHSEYFEIPLGVVNQEKILNIYLKRIGQNEVLEFKALFEYNSAKITDNARASLEKLRAFLENNPTLRCEIGGHTDNIGTEGRNMQLSADRAKAVQDYLIDKGINAARLSYKGYGESKPVASNATPYGRSLNRRTECRIIKIDEES